MSKYGISHAIAVSNTPKHSYFWLRSYKERASLLTIGTNQA